MPYDSSPAGIVRRSLIAERKAKSVRGKMHATGKLEVRSVTEDPDNWWIEGTATTPKPDFVGDVVNPMGLSFNLPMPLLWQHDSGDPIGLVVSAKPTSKGVTYKARIPKIKTDGLLRDRLQMAVDYITHELTRDTSIGFMPDWDVVEVLATGGLLYPKSTWLELSVCTIGMNEDADIISIRSMGTGARAATGNSQAKTQNTTPGASGTSSGQSAHPPNRTPKGQFMKTIAQLQERRGTAVARMKELGDLWAGEGYTKSQEERDELQTLDTEVKDLDDSLIIAKAYENNGAVAKPVAETERAQRGAAGYIMVKGADQEEKFKGQNYTRMVIAKAQAHLMFKRDGVPIRPSEIAEERWGKTNPTLVAIMKANEVPGGGTGSGEWGRLLVQADTRYTGDFIEFLYGMTVFDKLPLREIPANVAVKGQDGAATAYWVGESKAIPNTSATFTSTNLAPLKVGAIAVCSNELLEDSSPAAEGLVRDAIGEASAQRIDTTFLSATAASAGVSPAGMLNGVSATAASGVDASALRADLKAVLATFDTAKDSGTLTIVTTRALARSVALMFNNLGTAQDFPGSTPTGGTWMGYPVIVGDNVPSGDIIVLNPREIYKIGDSGVRVSVSDVAMIEQSSAPTGATDTPVAASQVFTSMFQEESTAIKVVRRINFAKRRSTAVGVITGGDYGSDES